MDAFTRQTRRDAVSHLFARVSHTLFAQMAPELKPIDPKTPRWEPTAHPADIVVPGLDTTAPPYDQIEQIEQLITIKLQVPLPLYMPVA